MSKIFPSWMYGDPSNIVDGIQRMEEKEKKKTPEFKERLKREIREWKEKQRGKKIG